MVYYKYLIATSTLFELIQSCFIWVKYNVYGYKDIGFKITVTPLDGVFN